MLCTSALEAAEPAASPSDTVNTRGAMARRPRVYPTILLHRNPHAWVGHAAASAAGQTTSLQLHRDMSLVD
jgi:hypothetical protein